MPDSEAHSGNPEEHKVENMHPDVFTEAPPPGENIEVTNGTMTPTSLSSIQKKGGRLLSVLMAINVLLIGCALVSGGGLKNVDIHKAEVFCLLTVLMGLAITCMVAVLYFTSRNQDAVLYKDSHAGPIWLRVGLIFFGILTVVQDVFKIGHYVPLLTCESPINLVYPVIQSIFVIFQTYFIWVTCKKCIQIHTNLTRYALMILLITNLVVWMSAVTDESKHHNEEERQHQDSLHGPENQSLEKDRVIDEHTGDLEYTALGAHEHQSEACYCNTSICQIFETGFYYMYPFNIEYSLFASTLIYIMWRNVGRLIDDNVPHKKRPWKLCFCMPTYFLGVIFGLAVLAVGLVALTYYKVLNSSVDHKALTMMYIFGICGLSLMSVTSLMGSIIYRFDKRDIVNHKNPSRTLDVTLLLGAALGQYCISYFSIVAIIARRPSDQLAVLDLVFSLFVIVQHSFQNIFIIEGLHRLPYEDTEQHDSENPAGLFYANEPVISHFHERDGSFSSAATTQSQEAAPSAPTATPGMQGTPVTEASHRVTPKKTHCQRMIMREILLFLLLCNVIFWIIPAFGVRPQLRYKLEEEFYGEYMWDLIVNVCLPFGIFYRLHSVASLLEVFMKT